MGLLEWQVTVNIRPIRAICNLLAVAAISGVLALPSRVAIEKVPRVKPTKTVEQVSRENALSSVTEVVADRMSYLDPERRSGLASVVVEESLECGFDPLFMLAVGDTESKFDHEAVSPTGALGLYQVIPSTWNLEVKRRGLGRLEKFNVAHNAKVGIGYLCYLAKGFKRPDSLLLAYNQGPGGATAIIAQGAEPSPEAATYAAKVWRSYKVILARFGLPNSSQQMRASYKRPESTIFKSALVKMVPETHVMVASIQEGR